MTSLPIDPYPIRPAADYAPKQGALSETSGAPSFEEHLQRSAPASQEQGPTEEVEDSLPESLVEEEPTTNDSPKEGEQPPLDQTTPPAVEGEKTELPEDNLKDEEGDLLILASDVSVALPHDESALTEGEEGSPDEVADVEETQDEPHAEEEGHAPLPQAIADPALEEDRSTAPIVIPSKADLPEATEGDTEAGSKKVASGSPVAQLPANAPNLVEESETAPPLEDAAPVEEEAIAPLPPNKPEAANKKASDAPLIIKEKGEEREASPAPTGERSAKHRQVDFPSIPNPEPGDEEAESPRVVKERLSRPSQAFKTAPAGSSPSPSPLLASDTLAVPPPEMSVPGEIMETRSGERSSRGDSSAPLAAPPAIEPKGNLQQKIVGIELPREPAEALTPPERNRFLTRVARAFAAAGDREGPIHLRLSPPELGALRLEIQIKSGDMIARFEAETMQARGLLLDNLQGLRERLADQGIRIDQFDVDLTDQQSPDSGMPHNDEDAPLDKRQHREESSRSASEAQEPGTSADQPDESEILLPDRVNIVV